MRILALAAALSLPVVACADSVEVTASALRVRKGKSTKTKTLKVAPRGSILLTPGELPEGFERTWVRVSYDNVSGYVYGKYIKAVTDPTKTNTASSGSSNTSTGGKKQEVTASALNLRNGPGLNNARKGLLKRGTKLDVLDTQGNWSRIRTEDGQEGWVHNGYLGDPGSSGSSSSSSSSSGSRSNSSNNATSLPASQSSNESSSQPASNGRGRVNYNGKRVSDATVRNVLQRIADHFGRTVSVTSGNRGHVPQGGSSTSWHLKHRAADFHVVGVSDQQVFNALRQHRSTLLREGTFEVIWHTANTNTSGQHVHIGNRAPGGTVYKVESYGNYRRVN